MNRQSPIILVVLMLYAVSLFSQMQPNIRMISFNPDNNNDIEIQWDITTHSTDVEGFIIYLWDETQDTIHHITDSASRSWTYSIRDHKQLKNYIFTVATKYNGIESPISKDLLQSIILDDTATTYEPCEKYNSLIFKEYMLEGLAPEYIIYCKQNDQPWEELDKIITAYLEPKGTETISRPGYGITFERNIYEYRHQDVEPEQTYSYYVAAHFPDGSYPDANSNSTEVFTKSYLPPAAPKIQSVSVLDNHTIEISYQAEEAMRYKALYLSRNNDEGFDSYTLPMHSFNPLSFEDSHELNCNAHSYYYKLFMQDSCNNLHTDDKVHRSILLEYGGTENNEIQLRWNSYEGWETGSQEIILSGGNRVIAIHDNAQEYNIPIDDLFVLSAPVSIQLKAVGREEHQLSYSNILQFDPEAEPVMPNAFNPYSSIEINRSFKPVQPMKSEGYKLAIFNRQGVLLWEYSNPSEGWDGKYQDKMQPTGTYVYQMQYQDSAGTIRHKNGTVLLIY